MNALLEDIRVDAAIVANTTSSSLYSQSFSMGGYHGAAAVISVGTMPATGDAITMAFLGGDSTTVPTSMSSIAGAEISIGTSSTKGTVYNASKVQINVLGSAIASALSLVVGTSTFISDSTASSTGGAFISGAASAVAKSLSTLIQTWYPAYNTTYSGTGSTACAVTVELINIKPETTALRIASTAQATAGGLGVQSLKSHAIVSLTPAKLMATASSFTNFSIRVNTTGASTIPINVTVFRDPVYSPEIGVGWGHTKV